MDFELTHTVRIPFDEYFDVVLSDALVGWVKEKLQQDAREVIQSEELDGVLRRTVRSERVLSAKAQKHFKVPRFVVEERQQIRRDQGSTTWEYVPNVGAKRFTAQGITQAEADPEGTRLTIRGAVSFRIPLIGKRIERHTVAWVKENFHKALGGLEEFYRTAYKAEGA